MAVPIRARAYRRFPGVSQEPAGAPGILATRHRPSAGARLPRRRTNSTAPKNSTAARGHVTGCCWTPITPGHGSPDSLPRCRDPYRRAHAGIGRLRVCVIAARTPSAAREPLHCLTPRRCARVEHVNVENYARWGAISGNRRIRPPPAPAVASWVRPNVVARTGISSAALPALAPERALPLVLRPHSRNAPAPRGYLRTLARTARRSDRDCAWRRAAGRAGR